MYNMLYTTKFTKIMHIHIINKMRNIMDEYLHIHK